MPDYGIMKNSEGYFDPTAGTAIKNIAKPGEFWEFRNRGGEYREVLIVNNNGDFCNILHVLDECKKGCVQVDHGKYANPQMLNWTHTGYLSRCIGKMDDDDFKELVHDISESLNIHIEIIETVKTVEAPESSAELKVALAEAEKAKNQLEIMKEMYASLLEKVL